MTQRFEQWKQLLQLPSMTDAQHRSLFGLMRQAYLEDCQDYCAHWLPYLSEYKHHFNNQVFYLHGLDELLKSIQAIPDAIFAVQCAHNIDTLMEIIEHSSYGHRIEVIEICMVELGINELDTLISSTQPSRLSLESCFLEDEGAQLIARSPNLNQLRQLALVDNDIYEDGVRALAEHMIQLTHLDLTRNWMWAPGVAHIAKHMTSLRYLTLASCDLGHQAVVHLTQESALQLHTLNLSDNHYIGDESVEFMAQSTCFRALEHLDLRGNDLGPQSAFAIARSTNLPSLRTLHLGLEQIGEDGIKAIANAPHLSDQLRQSYQRHLNASKASHD